MTTAALQSVVLKTASRCNLDCTYCYEYNRGDTSWKTQAKKISETTAALVGQRIAEYSEEVGAKTFAVNLHGGEPTLVGPNHLDAILTALGRSAQKTKLRFGMQTNATLISPDLITVLKNHAVMVGASLDGDAYSNRARIDQKGRPSWGAAVDGIHRLRDAGILAGIQAVIDLESEPERVLDSLAILGPSEIELGQPFGNYDNPPSVPSGRNLGDWLIRAYEHCASSPLFTDIRVNVIADAFTAILTGRSRSDWFPSASPGYLVITTDGAYEGLDTLKIVGSEGRVLGMSVDRNSIREALTHPFITARDAGLQLPTECRECEISIWCRGGYYPTRFGRGRGFDNPSIYCGSLKKLFFHLARVTLERAALSEAERESVRARVAFLGEQLQHE